MLSAEFAARGAAREQPQRVRTLALIAPFAFLSLRLFGTDIRTVYEGLEMPVWLAHGTRSDFKDFSSADWTRSRANWPVETFAAGAIPHCEQPDRFAAQLRAFCEAPMSAAARCE